MKSTQGKILKLLLTFLVLLIVGCETERIVFKGPYHVRFTESSGFAKESLRDVVQIEVHLVAPALGEDVVIHYQIGGDARENVDYVILGDRGEVTIEEGGYFGNIEIELINNSNNIIRSQDIVFTLESTTQNELRIGQGESEIGKSFTYTIFDDCILGGTYIGNRGSTHIGNISITSQNCEDYTLSNWNVGVFDTDVEMNLTFVDNGDNTLTIPRQEEENLNDEIATIEGIGVVDPITRQIIFTITLLDFEDQPEVTITYQAD